MALAAWGRSLFAVILVLVPLHAAYVAAPTVFLARAREQRKPLAPFRMRLAAQTPADKIAEQVIRGTPEPLKDTSQFLNHYGGMRNRTQELRVKIADAGKELATQEWFTATTLHSMEGIKQGVLDPGLPGSIANQFEACYDSVGVLGAPAYDATLDFTQALAQDPELAKRTVQHLLFRWHQDGSHTLHLRRALDECEEKCPLESPVVFPKDEASENPAKAAVAKVGVAPLTPSHSQLQNGRNSTLSPAAMHDGNDEGSNGSSDAQVERSATVAKTVDQSDNHAKHSDSDDSDDDWDADPVHGVLDMTDKMAENSLIIRSHQLGKRLAKLPEWMKKKNPVVKGINRAVGEVVDTMGDLRKKLAMKRATGQVLEAMSGVLVDQFPKLVENVTAIRKALTDCASVKAGTRLGAETLAMATVCAAPTGAPAAGGPSASPAPSGSPAPAVQPALPPAPAAGSPASVSSLSMLKLSLASAPSPSAPAPGPSAAPAPAAAGPCPAAAPCPDAGPSPAAATCGVPDLWAAVAVDVPLAVRTVTIAETWATQAAAERSELVQMLQACRKRCRPGSEWPKPSQSPT